VDAIPIVTHKIEEKSLVLSLADMTSNSFNDNVQQMYHIMCVEHSS